MPEPRLRSPVARAVVPVLAGMAVIAAVFGVLWLTAVAITHHARDVQTRPGSDLFVVGRVDRLVDSVSANGPILLPDLVGPAGRRPVGLAHEGTTDFDGWRVFSLRPAGNAADCLVALDRTTKQLTDCNGRVYSPSELPPADRVEVLVNRDNGTLSLDLNPGSS